MGQELALGTGNNPMPEHLRKLYEGRESNVMDVSVSIPSLSITGKVWTVKIGSESIVMKTKDADGNPINVQTLPLVILDYAKNRGRSYYEGAYNPDNIAGPDCWSNDGIVPDASIPAPINPRCNGCEMSIKGSRVTDKNTSVAACSEHRILAVIPAKKLGGQIPPLRLKIAQTSDYDGQSKELQADGWFAFSNFLSYLKTRNIQFIDALVVKVTFDSTAAYPKLLFSADEWLDQDQGAQVKALRERPEMATILGQTAEMPAGGRQVPPARQITGTAKTAADEAPKETATAKKARLAAEKATADAAVKAAADAAQARAEPEEDEDEKAMRLLQEKVAAKKAAAAATEKTTDEPEKTPAAADKPKPDNAPVSAPEVSKDAAALLGGWD